MMAWMAIVAAALSISQGEDPRPMCVDLSDPRRIKDQAPDIILDVDASDIVRSLVRSKMTIGAKPGPMDLWYVLWTPGNHMPSGPIENVGELSICDCLGNPLEWRRDPMNVNKIRVVVPKGCDHIGVSMTYIANQPNTNSRSTDTYGKPWVGVLNWNTVLWYPSGVGTDIAARDISVQASLRTPTSWAIATSLRPTEEAASSFATVPLTELVDSPVLFGGRLIATELRTPGAPDHAIVVAADDAKQSTVSPFVKGKLEAMVGEAAAIFGGFPFEHYRFLLTVGDGLGGAVEHARSTLTMMSSGSLFDATEDKLRGGAHGLSVLPHEYFHVWCGKMARPAGLTTESYHQPADTSLLWVYEGLTSYYDDVLTVRSGMSTFAEWRENLIDAFTLYQQREGRLWRSIEDSALAARHLRQRGVTWYDLRQGLEYYGQAAMFWLEADAIIRRGTDGKRSLDDFCKELFNVQRFKSTYARPDGTIDPKWMPLTYTREDVVRTLASVFSGEDWDALIRERIERPAKALDMSDVLAKVGVRLEWSSEPSEIQRRRTGLDDEGNPLPGGETNLRTSLGIVVDADGVVREIVPYSPADIAGMAYTTKIVAVDGHSFTPERLKEAVRASTKTAKVDVLVEFNDEVSSMSIGYRGGLRYGRFVRIDGEPDVLSEIAKPRRVQATRR